MIFRDWAIVAVILLMGSSLMLIISRNWRQYIAALSVQYLAVFWLVGLVWPIGLAAVKLIVGWMAGAVLGSSQSSQDLQYEHDIRFSGSLFRLLAAIMVWVIVFSLAPAFSTWISAPMVILWGGAVLIGMGLLQLGTTTRPLRAVGGILTVFSGFEILYALVEVSVLVTGLLAVTTLGLALVGAYLMTETDTSIKEELAVEALQEELL